MVDEEQQYEPDRDDARTDEGESLIYRMPAEEIVEEPPIDEPVVEEPPIDEPPAPQEPTAGAATPEVPADESVELAVEVDAAEETDDISAAIDEAVVSGDEVVAPDDEGAAPEEDVAATEVAAPSEESPAPMDKPAVTVTSDESAAATGDLGWMPFLVYDAIWVVFVALLVWQLLEVPADNAVYESALYPLFLIAGITLLVAGPVLIWALWWTGRTETGRRTGLFTALLYRGAVATFTGVALWWAALLAIDFLRLGRLL